MPLSNEEKQTLSNIADQIRDLFSNNILLLNPIENINLIDPNIILIRLPIDTQISGFFTKLSDNYCIYINSSFTLGHQYTTFWHEYYHAIDDETTNDILLTNISEPETFSVEDHASYFAYCMLLPETALRNTIIGLNKDIYHINISDIIELQQKFQVSLQSLIYRLKELYKWDGFNKFFSYSKEENALEYKNLLKEAGYSATLIEPTNDICLPKQFIEDVLYNLKNNLINEELAYGILKFIEDKGVHFKW